MVFNEELPLATVPHQLLINIYRFQQDCVLLTLIVSFLKYIDEV